MSASKKSTYAVTVVNPTLPDGRNLQPRFVCFGSITGDVKQFTTNNKAVAFKLKSHMQRVHSGAGCFYEVYKIEKI